MKRSTYLAGIVALCATILVSAGLLAQETPYDEMSPEQQAMMKAWMANATPGEQHQLLAKKVGVWEVNGKMWHEPNSEPELFDGTSTIEAIMDGRYFLEKIDGSEFMGMPFEGRSVFGYDNLTQTYFVYFFDNMNTGVSRYEGTPSGDGKTIHYTVQVPDLMAGKYKTARAVETMISDDKIIFTMYDTTPDGTEFTAMEVISTRKGTSDWTKSKTKKKGY